jgi:hypothetical protein
MRSSPPDGVVTVMPVVAPVGTTVVMPVVRHAEARRRPVELRWWRR